ncbi:MAG: serine hydrolase [Saprospiraceae bacterium]|nr:serine hydrolase [Candidatus Vicinibacter affinis]
MLFSSRRLGKYSNTNTFLMAMVIEAATGRQHSELIKERLLNPNHLDDTYYYWHDIPPSHTVAQGYFDLYNNGTNCQPDQLQYR